MGQTFLVDMISTGECTPMNTLCGHQAGGETVAVGSRRIPASTGDGASEDGGIPTTLLISINRGVELDVEGIINRGRRHQMTGTN